MQQFISHLSGPWGEGPSKPSPDLDKLLSKSQAQLRRMFKHPGQPKSEVPPVRGLALLVGAVLTLWLLTGFYTVAPDEEAVVLRFGRYHRTERDGLHYQFPSPLEEVTKVKNTTINQEEIGFRRQPAFLAKGDMSTHNINEESLMLTGDENIIDIHFEIQWRVSDAKDYLFNVRNAPGENTVKDAAESAVREVIGRTPITGALMEGRQRIEAEARALLQTVLDSYKCGIRVERLQMLKADPPQKVIDAFRDVQTAKADKEREINQAEAYRNDVIPRARGEAARLVEEANGYAQEVVARAEGDVQRFNAVYQQYVEAKDVTRKRMYLETMEMLLQRMPKWIIDDKQKGILPYLPLADAAPRVGENKAN